MEHFDFDDPLNRRIWSESPAIQRTIHPPAALREPGAVGAQQAMLHRGAHPRITDESVLPWVPDLVGKRWRERDSLLIVGSAYAGFIQEYSTRSRTIRLFNYASATSVAEFQPYYLQQVVSCDTDYYGPIHSLVKATSDGGFEDASWVALFDLCRASFVARGNGPDDKRGDRGGDGIVKQAPERFARYVESGASASWTWERFVSSRAFRIVALGTIAEHGLLRLFHDRGLQIRAVGSTASWTSKPGTTGRWVLQYADPKRQLGSWIAKDAQTWWTIYGDVDGEERVWYLLPIYHPARYQKPDPHYAGARAVLRRMVEQ